MDQASEIPIFPLSTVLFPGGRLPLRVFEPRYLTMTAQCLRDNSVFGVALIRGGFEVGRPAIPWDLGCTARIVECRQPQPDLYVLLAQGESVFRIERRWTEEDGLIRARVQLGEPPDPTPVPAAFEPLAALLRRIAEEPGPARFPQPARFDDAGWVAFRLAEMLPVAPERKQRLLELNDPLKALAEIERQIEELRGERSQD